MSVHDILTIHLKLLWHHLTIFSLFNNVCIWFHSPSTPSFQIAILHFVKLRNNKSYCSGEATCNSISRAQSATLIGRTYHCKVGMTIHAPNAEFIGQFIGLFLSWSVTRAWLDMLGMSDVLKLIVWYGKVGPRNGSLQIWVWYGYDMVRLRSLVLFVRWCTVTAPLWRVNPSNISFSAAL